MAILMEWAEVAENIQEHRREETARFCAALKSAGYKLDVSRGYTRYFKDGIS